MELAVAKDRLLAAWLDGVASDAQVAAWAERQLLACEDGAIPMWLVQLVETGPGACQEIAGFGWPERLDYLAGFSIRAAKLSLDDDDGVLEFAHWAARRSLGGDHDVPEVVLGYYLDHLIDDCRRPDEAVEHLRNELPQLLSRCRERAAEFLELLGQL